ncbi:MAG TPA: AAA family ATPase [Jatrophihabitans sp.]|jgi:DNA-binding CsgD family transcriptional regulator|nr:AAA family ATPase [Jatrophihabitans sp.]
MRSRVMVGRDAELSALAAAAARARQGEVGLVLVTGEAGIGKSRLVSDFVSRLDDALTLMSHGVAMSTGEIPFGVLADLLKNLLGTDPTALTDSERGALAPLLPGTARSGDRVGMLSAALDLLDRLSAQRLVVWVLDDLHWADAASRDLLTVALRTRPGHRLLVVATVRTDDPARDSEQEHAVAREIARLAQLPVTETMHLRRLVLADVRRQLAGMDVSLDAGARARVEELSAGIPFVVEELVATAGVPERTTQLIASRSRLTGLAPDAVRLVEAAAVGDGHLRLKLLEQVTDLAEDELDDAIKAATNAGVLDEQPSHEELAFRHPLLRAAVDESIAPGARRGWHRRWAEVLEANPGKLAASPTVIAVAQHWAGSGDAAHALAAAARAAIAAGELDLHEVEAEMWERVLELWDGVKPLPGLEQYTEREIRRFRRWAVGQVDNDRFLEVLSEDLRLANDPSTRACLELAVNVHSGTALGSSAGPGDRAELEERARSGPRDLVLAIFLSNLGEAILQEGETVAARELIEESLVILRERGDTRTAIRSTALLAYVDAAVGRAEQAIPDLERLLEDPTLDRTYVRRWVGNILILLQQLVGNAAAANAAFDIVASTLDTRLDWPTFALQLNYILPSWLHTGRWEHARTQYEAMRPNWAGHLVMSDLHIAQLDLMARGEVADPDLWRNLPDRAPEQAGIDPLSAAMMAAQVCGVAGDLARMRQLLGPVWEQAHPQFSDHAVLGLMWAAVRDFTRLEVDAASRRPDADDRPAAEAHLTTIVTYANRMHRYAALGKAWPVELEAQLARFRADERQFELFETAIDRWRAIGHDYDAAVCSLRLAEVLAARGERPAARSYAEAALATANTLGAAPLRCDAEGLIDRLGSTQRAEGQLTQREREVLVLIAQGRTNEQIGTALFMSPKTASVHVSRIITKLGAANRTEASAIARRTGLVTD